MESVPYLGQSPKRSTDSLRAQFNAMEMFNIIAETDTKGQITYVNDKFIEISKFSRDELLGEDHRIINSGYHPADFFRDLWQTICNGKIWTGEIRNRAKDGSYYWVSTIITPIFNSDQKITGYLAIRRDITTHKNAALALRTAEKSLSQLIDNAHMIALGLNQTGHLVFCNQVFLDITGYKRREVLGKQWVKNFIPERFRHEAKVDLNALTKEGVQQLKSESWILTKKNQERFISWISTDYRSGEGKVLGMTAIGEDVTEKRAKEIELEKLKRQAQKQQEDVMAFVSHELRSPLMSLKAGLELLEMRLDEMNIKDQECADGMKLMYSQISRMDRVSRDLLNTWVHKDHQKDLELKEVELVGFLEKLILQLQYLTIDWKGKLKLKLNPPKSKIVGFWDAGRLEQALTNLISNAVKYSKKEGGEVEISARPKDTKTIEIKITDQGIGIPPQSIDTIFEKFSRAENALKSKTKGYGLGLKITKDIIKQHGGKVWVESVLGEGSCFHIELPLNSQ